MTKRSSKSNRGTGAAEKKTTLRHAADGQNGRCRLRGMYPRRNVKKKPERGTVARRVSNSRRGDFPLEAKECCRNPKLQLTLDQTGISAVQGQRTEIRGDRESTNRESKTSGDAVRLGTYRLNAGKRPPKVKRLIEDKTSSSNRNRGRQRNKVHQQVLSARISRK